MAMNVVRSAVARSTQPMKMPRLVDMRDNEDVLVWLSSACSVAT